jgi:hypothetical protein
MSGCPIIRPQLLLLTTMFLVFGALATGCATDPVETSVTFDPLTAFPAQATYAWDESRNKLPLDERLAALDLGDVIRAAAEAEFAKRGYTLAPRESAQYLMSYQAATNSWIGADNSRAVGTVSLLLVEAASGRRVWIGFGRSDVQVGRDRAGREQRMREAFAKMLKNFPPNQGK